ncbi:MAG: hypothetical protein AB1742_15230 [bacterium]
MAHVNHRLRRNKALGGGSASHGLMAAAVDGWEAFSSEKRCCPACLTRKKDTKDGEITEYYHRYVFCQLILRPIPSILDIEPILPGEGETAAAKRLIQRILTQQPRMVDLFSFDALYADRAILRSLNKAGKYWVVVMKVHRFLCDLRNCRSGKLPLERNPGEM